MQMFVKVLKFPVRFLPSGPVQLASFWPSGLAALKAALSVGGKKAARMQQQRKYRKKAGCVFVCGHREALECQQSLNMKGHSP